MSDDGLHQLRVKAAETAAEARRALAAGHSPSDVARAVCGILGVRYDGLPRPIRAMIDRSVT